MSYNSTVIGRSSELRRVDRHAPRPLRRGSEQTGPRLRSGQAIGVAGPRTSRQAAAEHRVQQGTDLSRIGMYAQDGGWGLDLW